MSSVSSFAESIWSKIKSNPAFESVLSNLENEAETEIQTLIHEELSKFESMITGAQAASAQSVPSATTDGTVTQDTAPAAAPAAASTSSSS